MSHNSFAEVCSENLVANIEKKNVFGVAKLAFIAGDALIVYIKVMLIHLLKNKINTIYLI